MADEKIDRMLKPEIISRACPGIINPKPTKSVASEEDYVEAIERNTIAEFKEGEGEEEKV